NLVRDVEARNDEYQFDRSMALIQEFLWHEFADHYVELVKHRAYSEKDEGARYALYTVGLGLLKMVSVFLPHVAEDAYQSSFKKYEESVSIHVSEWPEAPEADEAAERNGDRIKAIVAGIRSWKSSKGISLNSEISRVEIVGESASEFMAGSEEDVRATVKASELEVRAEVPLKEIIVKFRPVHSRLGPAFRSDAKEISNLLASADPSEVEIRDGVIELGLEDGRRVELQPEHYTLEKRLESDKGALEHISVDGRSVLVYL
ncbi:MAG: class I tRNA ligase family protein, partial [Thermoplasmata archaeon]